MFLVGKITLSSKSTSKTSKYGWPLLWVCLIRRRKGHKPMAENSFRCKLDLGDLEDIKNLFFDNPATLNSVGKYWTKGITLNRNESGLLRIHLTTMLAQINFDENYELTDSGDEATTEIVPKPRGLTQIEPITFRNIGHRIGGNANDHPRSCISRAFASVQVEIVARPFSSRRLRSSSTSVLPRGRSHVAGVRTEALPHGLKKLHLLGNRHGFNWISTDITIFCEPLVPNRPIPAPP